MNKIEIFIDGACSNNPGKGGYGVIVLEEIPYIYDLCKIKGCIKSIDYKYSEYIEDTTNNREELKALIHALEIAKEKYDNKCVIYSDSAYVVNIYNDWIFKWANNNWKNSKNEIVENLDLIQTLYKYINKNFDVCQVKKIKGHANILGNELADAAASNNENKFNKLCKENNIIKNDFI